MDSMASKINELLQDPETMEQIRSLAAMFGGDGAAPDPPAEHPAESAPAAAPAEASRASPPPPMPPPGGSGGLGGLGGLGDLGGMLSPELLGTVMKLAPVLSGMRKETPNTHFLKALRPLLSDPRQKKLDEAVKIMQLMSVLPALKQTGILSSLL